MLYWARQINDWQEMERTYLQPCCWLQLALPGWCLFSLFFRGGRFVDGPGIINCMLVPGAQPWAKQSSPITSHDKADGPAKLSLRSWQFRRRKRTQRVCPLFTYITNFIRHPTFPEKGCCIKDQLGKERSGSKQSETVAHYGGFILTSAAETGGETKTTNCWKWTTGLSATST